MKNSIADTLLTNLCYLDYQLSLARDEKSRRKIMEMIEIVEGNLRSYYWSINSDLAYEV